MSAKEEELFHSNDLIASAISPKIGNDCFQSTFNLETGGTKINRKKGKCPNKVAMVKM